MFNWLKKHKILVCLFSIIIILGVPLAIHILFKINSGIPFFEAEWTAGEALGYYGSILSFIQKGFIITNKANNNELVSNKVLNVKHSGSYIHLTDKSQKKNRRLAVLLAPPARIELTTNP